MTEMLLSAPVSMPELRSAVADFLGRWLRAECMRVTPCEPVREQYAHDFAAFASWTASHGLPPDSGAVASAYLLELGCDEDVEIDILSRIADALVHYLDREHRAPIGAALRFCAHAQKMEKNHAL